MPAAMISLDTPFTTDTLIQIRTSKMKRMRNLNIETGIYKQPREEERVWCGKLGLDGDEHDLTFHGGIDKAVHQYFWGHYRSWNAELGNGEFGSGGGNFKIGGFGENLVTSGNMNERNICMGDIIRIGPPISSSFSSSSEEEREEERREGVLLQVSLPRQPCFKLNHRFSLKNFAPQTFKKSRTGWYYRVLREGYIKIGDEMRLIERRNPTWTIERVQEYLHRDKSNLPMLEELGQVKEMGDEAAGGVKRLIAQCKKDEEEKEKKREEEKWVEFEVVEKKVQTRRITSFFLQGVEHEGEGEELDPGVFARLKLPNGLIRSYSIVSGASNRFQLGIALEDPSRGGSAYMHDTLKEGDKILVGKLTESVPIPEGSSNHIFIAGGIGITAFLMHMDIYNQINFNFTLHYAIRSSRDIPFLDMLEKLGMGNGTGKVRIYDKEKGERMNISSILRERVWNSHVYTCGPERMISGVKEAANACGMTTDEIHYEAFHMDIGGDPFTVSVKGGREGEKLEVGEEETMLSVLKKAGFDIDSSCEMGNCGTCKVMVCKGKVEHRGSALSEEDKAKGEVLSCVSRGVGHLVIEF